MRHKTHTFTTRSYLQFLEVVNEQAETFGAFVRQLRKESRLTVDGLAKKAGLSKQYISVLERAEPHPLTGKPIVPKLDTVDAIAHALGVDQDKARVAAGYAPSAMRPGPPADLAELLEILDGMGIENLHFANHDEMRKASPEELQEVLQAIELAVDITLRRQSRQLSHGSTQRRNTRVN